MSAAVFDSNILIDALKGIGAAEHEIQSFAHTYISRITWIEVLTGALPAESVKTLAFLRYFTMIELDEAVARRAAALRSERKRLKVGDAIILASAQHLGYPLVTRNTRDFPAHMPGIRVPYTL